MVCIPCFIVPVLLYIWHKFLQPILFKYWNPWGNKIDENKAESADSGTTTSAGGDDKLGINCNEGKCTFNFKKKAAIVEDKEEIKKNL